MEKSDLKMKKNDLFLIIGLLIVAVVAYVGIKWYESATTNEPVAVVTVDGVEYGRYPLSKDCSETIEFENGKFNTFVIKDGHADMIEASCQDKICVNHNEISKKSESIVCLPNKVVIEIENGEEAEVDGSTH